MTRTFRPGAHYMVTHRMARVLVRFDGNGVWSIRAALEAASGGGDG